MLSNAKTFTLMLMIFSDLDHHRHHREEEFFRDPVLARLPRPLSRQSQGLVDHDIDDDDDDDDDDVQVHHLLSQGLVDHDIDDLVMLLVEMMVVVKVMLVVSLVLIIGHNSPY